LSIFQRELDPSRKHGKDNIQGLGPDAPASGFLIGLRADSPNSGAFGPQSLLSEAYLPPWRGERRLDAIKGAGNGAGSRILIGGMFVAFLRSNKGVLADHMQDSPS
jgi:hypothetical protein